MDGAQSLNQRFEDSDERLTEEEVQAIVKRYGERQSGSDTRATVADVAEALQVEPSVVSRILRDVRTAESEKQIQERLAALERENAELRRRAEESEYEDFYSHAHWARSRRLRGAPRFAIAAMMAAFLAMGLVLQARGGMNTPLPIVAMLLVMGGVFWAVRMIRRS